MSRENYATDLSFERSELPMEFQDHLHRPLRIGRDLLDDRT